MTRTVRRVAIAGTLTLAATPARAQLRPLEPAPWEVFDADRVLTVDVGAGLLLDQPATLAGTVGRLAEIGNYHVAWRSGRIAIEVQGTALRAFHDETRISAPHSAVREDGPDRFDSGDHSLSTLIRLTPDRPSFAVLRFGTRLPNSDNRVGLDRDRTDFFATLGGQLRRGHYRVAAETGLGIFGTRLADYEQSDVLIYSVSLRRDAGVVTALATVTGHYTPHSEPRGNEDRSESRLGVQLGRGLRLSAVWVHGLTASSPRNGLLVTIGTRH